MENINAIKEFLAKEVDYTTLIEEAADAQAQLLNIMEEIQRLPPPLQPTTDKLTTFFYHAVPALKLLRAFSTPC